ncbi:hypothetical protein WJ970_02420 [Achromobacter xylosoxidans]
MLLVFQQLVLAQHRQPGQRRARIDRGGIDAAQLLGNGRRARHRVGDGAGQGGHQLALALLGRSCFQDIEKLGHGIAPSRVPYCGVVAGGAGMRPAAALWGYR